MPEGDEFQYTQVDDDLTFESLEDLQAVIDNLHEDLEAIINLGDDISNPESGRSDWEGAGQKSFRRIWQEGGWADQSVTFEDASGEAHTANDVSSALRMTVVSLESLKSGAEVKAQDIIDADEAVPFE
jgi:hypothetical protein